ncbi:DUF2298 domain-containing protein [Kiritimatiellota bacterium B12222]|nr:DUF2298 domain-containing protein [Kiritimatiellota bacterium B12222]
MNTLLSPDPLWWFVALKVYLVLNLMTYAAWPWFTRLFSGRPDRGAGLVMASGILVFLTASQLWWRTGLLEIHFVWMALLMMSVGTSGRKLFFNPQTPSFGTRSRMRRDLFQGWLLFSLLFWYWIVIRSADPGVTHTEQPMDVMWMQAAASSNQPPIRDAWFHGEPTTYYSDGQQALAFLGTKLGLEVQESVNLTQVIWFALTGLLAFHAAKSLYELSGKKGGNVAGIIALLFVNFVSTPQGFWDACAPATWWWWWDASRVITDDGSILITEFPFFSFWLGDNHAHVIGLPYLLLTLLAGTQLYRSRVLTLWHTLLPAVLVTISWRINPWQTPTALAFPFLCLLFRHKKIRRNEWKAIVYAWCIAGIFLYPARAHGPAMSLAQVENAGTSPLEFLKVFGFICPGLLWMFVKRPQRLWFAGVLLLPAMFLCVEVLYFQDTYQNRMNTLFKVYYQLWALIAVFAAVSWANVIQCKGWIKMAAVIALLCSLVPGLFYAGKLSWTAFQVHERSLNAWDVYPPELKTLLTVSKKLIQTDDLIAEAPGERWDPYSSMLGTWTKGDSLIGWVGHEQEWRPGLQLPPLERIYEAQTAQALSLAVNDLKVDWILLGPQEQEKYHVHPDWELWITPLSHRVIDQTNRRLYQIK